MRDIDGDTSHLTPASIKAQPRRKLERDRSVLRILLALAIAASFSCAAFAEAGWTMVSSQAADGAAVPAVMQVADFDRSDPGIAGLIFRCGAHQIETVVIIIEPLPPRTDAKIVISAAADFQTYEATIIPTGAGLRVELDPSIALSGPWRNATDLNVSITAAGVVSKAVFNLNGLSVALDTLKSRCAPAANP